MSPSRPDENPLPRAWVQAFRDDRAFPEELRRDYARFLRRRAQRRSGAWRGVRWLAIGLLVGAGLAQAAGLSSRAFRRSPTLHPLHSRSAVPAAKAATAVQARVPLADEAPASAEASSRPTHPDTVAATQSVGMPRPESTAARTRARWEAAAAALRAHDNANAERLLFELEQGATNEERDAAQLARAQLLASQGREAEARALLERLRAAASSRVVADRAERMLEDGSKKHDTNRSAQGSRDLQRP